MQVILNSLRKLPWWVVCACVLIQAQNSPLEKAEALYRKTDYDGALAQLSQMPANAAVLGLRGKAWFGKRDFEKASALFGEALRLAPKSSEWRHWLGRATGRRAEKANPFRQPFLARETVKYFEAAVALDGRNREALNDLLTYYLMAPGFLGGGLDRAEALAASRFKELGEADHEAALAQIAIDRKVWPEAEAHLRRAAELEPKSIGRWVDLGRFLERRGKPGESDAAFARAGQIDASRPELLYGRAAALIESGRNKPEARALLERYLASPRTPDDPTADEARALLNKLK